MALRPYNDDDRPMVGAAVAGANGVFGEPVYLFLFDPNGPTRRVAEGCVGPSEGLGRALGRETDP